MRSISLFILASFVAFHAVAKGQATIPFDFRRGLVEVDVLIDGRVKARFGIDTGADRLYLSSDFVKKSGLKTAGPSADRAIAGVNGIARGEEVELRSLSIGDQRLYNLNATAIDLAALVGSRDEYVRGLDGLIGHEILQRFYITVDYPRSTISIQMTQPDFLEDGDFEAIRFSRNRHFLLVDAVFNGAVEAPMVLDYCASHTSIDLALAANLKVEGAPGQVVLLSTVALSENIVSDSVYAVISDLATLKRAVPRADFAGLLGATFLYRYKITVDYKREKIYFHRK